MTIKNKFYFELFINRPAYPICIASFVNLACKIDRSLTLNPPVSSSATVSFSSSIATSCNSVAS